MEVRRTGYTGVSDAPNGVNLKVKCVKNKLAPPYRVGQIHLSFNHGLDQDNELIDLLISQGSLVSKGGWYQWNGQNIAHGRAQLLALIKNDPQLKEQMRQTYQPISNDPT